MMSSVTNGNIPATWDSMNSA